MKVLWSVLSEFVDLDGLSPYEVSEALINSGLEVEDVEDLSKKLQGTVSVVINRISPHPYSPSLSVLDLSDGFCNYRVVCGARNINEGDIVILCKPGAILPDGTLVSEREIRGVLSQGMLLSEIEIGTDPCATGVLVFDRTTPVGLDGARLVYYDDFVLSVAPTPNRGDLLGVIGVAREVSALFSRELKMPSIDIYDDSSHVESVTDVIIEDSDLCKRYVAKFFDDVKIGPSPLWMKVRLLHFGMRPICNVVDVTNYVMMEFGQPLHAFDFDKLKGGKIVVRRARYGESIETLDGKLRELSTQDLVIADLERPVAIAGIMGGANTEVTEFTTRVLLESAYFDPVAIRKTAKAFGISTEASRRFERGVDIEGLYFAALRAATLIKETSGAKVYKGVIDRYPGRDGTRQIFFDPSYVSDFLGAKIDANESKKILVSLGFDVDDSRIPWLVKVPSWRRLDVTREVDLVEEVARVWGYDKIPDELPKGSLQRERPYSTYDFVTSIKRFMSALGLMEVITFSFIPGDFGKRLGESFGQLVFLENPISEEMSVMRPTLIYGLLDTVSYNHSVLQFDLAIFEVGKVFTKEERFKEKLLLGFALSGFKPKHWSNKKDQYDFFDAKGIIEALFNYLKVDVKFEPGSSCGYLHPKVSGRWFYGDNVVAVCGEVHPDVKEAFDLKRNVYIGEVLLESFVGLSKTYKFTKYSVYPCVVRDLSFIIDESIPYEEVERFLKGLNLNYLASFTLIDVFKGSQIGEGRVSYTVSFVFSKMDGTLTGEEVDDVFWKIAYLLEEKFQAEIRSRR